MLGELIFLTRIEADADPESVRGVRWHRPTKRDLE
jgi:hypothetical protein